MISNMLLRCILGWTITCLCLATLGCGSRNKGLKVLVKNESSLELHNICVALASSIQILPRMIVVLKTQECATIEFPAVIGEASFAISAEDSSGNKVTKNGGYLEHYNYKALITFKDLSGRSGIDVNINVD